MSHNILESTMRGLGGVIVILLIVSACLYVMGTRPKPCPSDVCSPPLTAVERDPSYTSAIARMKKTQEKLEAAKANPDSKSKKTAK